jgi:hypothetical protein
MEVVCSVCWTEFDAESAPAGVRCAHEAASQYTDPHFFCSDCVAQQIEVHLDSAPQTTLQLDDVYADVCCVGVGCNGVWPLAEVVPHLAPKTLVRFITARDGVVKMRVKIQRLTEQVSASAATPSPELFEEIIRLTLRSEGAVYQCRECKRGPVQHVHCANLLTHHKQKGVDNSCAFCGVEPRGAELAESYEEWDGTFAPEYFTLQRQERGRKRAWEESAPPHGALGERAARRVATAAPPAADPRWRCPGSGCAGGPLLMPGALCFKCARPDPELRNIECRAFRRNHDAVLLPALERIARCAEVCDEHYDDTLRGFPRFEAALAAQPVPMCGAEVIDALRALGIDAISPAVFTLLRPILQIENRCVESEFAESGVPVVIALKTRLKTHRSPARSPEQTAAAASRATPLDAIGRGVVFRAAKIHVCAPPCRLPFALRSSDGLPVTLDADGECSFVYRYISRESCSQFDSLPLTSLTISGAFVGKYNEGLLAMDAHAFERFLAVPSFAALLSPQERAAARGAFAATPRRCADEALSLSVTQWRDIAAMAFFLHTINADYCVARDAYHAALCAGIDDLEAAFPKSKFKIRTAFRNWLSNAPAASHGAAPLAKVHGQPEGVLALWIDELVKQTPSKRKMISRLSAMERALKNEARCRPGVPFDYNASLCAGVNGLAADPGREGPSLADIQEMEATFEMRKEKKEVCRSTFSATIERFSERLRTEAQRRRRAEHVARRARRDEERGERMRQLTMREFPPLARLQPVVPIGARAHLVDQPAPHPAAPLRRSRRAHGGDVFYDGDVLPTPPPRRFDFDFTAFDLGHDELDLELELERPRLPPLAPHAPPQVLPHALPHTPPTRQPHGVEVEMNLEGVRVATSRLVYHVVPAMSVKRAETELEIVVARNNRRKRVRSVESDDRLRVVAADTTQ